jgi:phosphate transport system permease protein
MTLSRRRKIEEDVFKVLMIGSTAVVVSSLLLILGTVIVKSLPALRLSMFFQTPKEGFYFGKEGGILNAILGSLYLAGGATLFAVVVSLPVVLYLNLYARAGSPLSTVTRFSLDVLWGVPSIVYGAFGFVVMMSLGLRASLAAGMITVGLLEIPIMARAMDEVVRLVPRPLLDASAALGATRLETALKVAVRQALPGLITAVLIALGRGIGDAASVLFTAGFTDNVPSSLLKPAATLPLAVFFQLGSPIPEVQQRAYASAAVLTLIVLTVSLAARALARRLRRHTIR